MKRLLAFIRCHIFDYQDGPVIYSIVLFGRWRASWWSRDVFDTWRQRWMGFSRDED